MDKLKKPDCSSVLYNVSGQKKKKKQKEEAVFETGRRHTQLGDKKKEEPRKKKEKCWNWISLNWSRLWLFLLKDMIILSRDYNSQFFLIMI